ncbi:Gdnf [Columba guinea]|nr:Gdnf [Columba guinea]
MKLWDVVAVCVVLLNTVSTLPLPTGKMPPKGSPSVVEGPEDDLSPISLLHPYAVHSDCYKPALDAKAAPMSPVVFPGHTTQVSTPFIPNSTYYSGETKQVLSMWWLRCGEALASLEHIYQLAIKMANMPEDYPDQFDEHMDALVSFVLSEAMHAALAQPLECTAKLTSTAFEAHGIEGIPPRMPPPLLLAAGTHPPYTKAADCILVEYGTH